MIDSRILELLNLSNEYLYVNYTKFLTPNEYMDLPNAYYNTKIYSFGKIRKIFAFVPEYIEEFDFPISLLKITINNKFREYTHKDFLGAIMSLSIKREFLGDLFVKNNVAYIYLHNSIKDIVINNLNEIGKNVAFVEEVFENIELDFEFKNIKINISSNRLDSIVASIANISRENSKEIIKQGLVNVNYEICYENSKELKENYILSIKKYGKYIIKNVERTTKNNRIILNVNKFV